MNVSFLGCMDALVDVNVSSRYLKHCDKNFVYGDEAQYTSP